MVKAYSTTDIGRKRTTNQDYVFASTEQVGKLPNLFLVADGMGGHNAGDFASRYAAEIMVQEIRRSEEDQIASILRHAIEAANAMIRLKASEDSAMLGMGTTLVAASIKGKLMEVANVGDSRLYVAEDTLHQITRDHSLVEEMVRMGWVSSPMAYSLPLGQLKPFMVPSGLSVSRVTRQPFGQRIQVIVLSIIIRPPFRFFQFRWLCSDRLPFQAFFSG